MENNSGDKEKPQVETNQNNDIGSGVNNGGKHGADHQVKEAAGDDADNIDISKENSSDNNNTPPQKIPEVTTPDYNGNNDADANKTQHPGR